MRLSNRMRDEITRRVLIDTFGKKHDQLRKTIDAYVTRCYRKEFDAEIQIANGIAREQADRMMKQWDGVIDLEVAGKSLEFLRIVGGYHTSDDANIAYRYKFGDLLLTNYRSTYNITREVHGEPLVLEGLALFSEIDEFQNSYDALRMQISGVLAACYSTKKALELLPEIEPYLPKQDVPSTQALVSVDILNSVRAVLAQNIKEKAA